MKHFQQPSNGWCVIHAFANIFQNENIIHALGSDDYYRGCDAKKTQQALQMFYPYGLSTVAFVDEPYGGIKQMTLKHVLSVDGPIVQDASGDSNVIIPYIVGFKNTPKSLSHAAAILRFKNRYLLMDSLKPKSQLLNLEELIMILDEKFLVHSLDTFTIKVGGDEKYFLIHPNNEYKNAHKYLEELDYV